MTQSPLGAAPAAPAARPISSASNIYTVLAAVAVLCLALATGFVAWKNMQLTGQGNPFFLEPTPASAQR